LVRAALFARFEGFLRPRFSYFSAARSLSVERLRRPYERDAISTALRSEKLLTTRAHIRVHIGFRRWERVGGAARIWTGDGGFADL